VEGLGDPVWAHYYRAVAEERQGKYKNAQAELLYLMVPLPSEDFFWRRFVEVPAKLGEPANIILTVLDDQVRKRPGDISTRVGACWIRAAFNQQLDLAVADCNEALRLKPGEPQALYARCFARFRRGELGLAVADCDEAVKSLPEERGYVAFHNKVDGLYVRAD
jgi:hypothetical protein